MAQPELWQFRFSMYPEKARWALDHKRIPHVRHSLLPGPHALQLIPRFGQKSMPIVKHDGKVVKGSANVIDYLERTFPDAPLYPADAQQRARALELQRWFDDELGPAIRRAAFFDLLPDTEYSARRFADGFPEWRQKLYVRTFPAVRVVMNLDMRITAAGAEEGRSLAEEALDFVARSAASGYLVGDRFSVADLTAATVLMVSCLPPEFPVAMPEPRPPGWRKWLERWQDHPGLAYVRRIYRDHRGTSSAVSE